MKAITRLTTATPLLLVLLSVRAASADVPPPPVTAPPVEPLPPPPQPSAPPPGPVEPAPPPVLLPSNAPAPPPAEAEDQRAPEPEMSTGRRIVSDWNSGFQWGLSPGVGFSNGKAGFLLGVRVGFGFDLGKVILIPGVQASAYFLDPTVLIGMPVFRVVLPIDRFAPFVQGGVGVGHVSTPSVSGAALSVGGGFMIHFTRSFALGAEATYQTITGTNFRGLGIGPIIAFAF